MRYAIIDTRMSGKCRISLKNKGFYLIEIPENCFLDKPISAHPDISVFVYKNKIVTTKQCSALLKEHLFWKSEDGCELKTESLFEYETRYPDDCALNFAVVGRYVVGNGKCMSKEIKNFINEHSLVHIDVKQGYSKCNICIVNDNAIITEDEGIAKECQKYGIDVLLLNSCQVKLDGYANGFIGGASGMYTDGDMNKILFCGNIENHPEYGSIENFCKTHGAVPISLSDEPLYDYGSIMIL